MSFTRLLLVLVTDYIVYSNQQIEPRSGTVNDKLNESVLIAAKVNEATEVDEKKLASSVAPSRSSHGLATEVEAVVLKQVNEKIAEFEDLKAQIAVIERHLRKHSDFEGFNTTDHVLVDLEENKVQPYEDDLVDLKNRIVNAELAIDASSMEIINSIVNEAEKFLDVNRDKVYGVLDEHVASKEHQHEHDDGSHDHASDYLDLLNDDETIYVAIEDEEAELLIEYIDMDIEEFKTLENQKLVYERHLSGKYGDDVPPNELQLKVAEQTLRDVKLNEIKEHEKKLLTIKNLIKNNKLLNVEEVQEMSSILEKAESFVDSSKDKMKLVGALGLESVVYRQVESSIKPSKENDVKERLVDVEFNKITPSSVPNDVVVSGVNNVSFAEVNKETKQLKDDFNEKDDNGFDTNNNVVLESLIPSFMSVHLSLTLLVTLSLFMMVVCWLVCCRARNYQSLSCEDGYGDKSRLVTKKGSFRRKRM